MHVRANHCDIYATTNQARLLQLIETNDDRTIACAVCGGTF